MNILRKTLSVICCVALLMSSLVLSVSNADTAPVTIKPSPTRYKVRLLLVELDYFTPSLNAFGGDDSKAYVNYGASHIAENEDWARIDYRDMNGTGELKSEYITLHDRDGDGRYNVVSSWGSKGGYFPSKDGIFIDGFPVNLYAQYFKKENELMHGNGQFGMYLQVAEYKNGGWEWTEGTNTDIGSATNESFGSEALQTYSGGIAYLKSNSPSGKGVVMYGETAVAQSKYPSAQGTKEPSASYASAKLTCPKTDEEAVSNTLNVTDAPLDQYGYTMAAQVTTTGAAEAGITQNGWNTLVSHEANLPGGDYNTESFNRQQIHAQILWPQVSGNDKTAEASFYAVDYKCEVFFYNSDSTLYHTVECYYGYTPNVTAPAKAYDAQWHYVNPTWNHPIEAVSDTADNTYTVTYTELAHAYTEYEQQDINKHLAYCSVQSDVRHSIEEYHDLDVQTKAATCAEGGYTRTVCKKCAYVQAETATSALPHVWNSGVRVKEPTCLESGSMLYTCQNCTASYTEPIGQLEHVLELRMVEPTNEHNGTGYYACKNCSCCWATVYNSETGDFDIPDSTPFSSPQQAIAASGSNLPSPAFNTFSDSDLGYLYSTRGASLKFAFDTLPDLQPLRFTCSVKVPEGINFRIRGEGNRVKDVGFIYTRNDYVGGDSGQLVKDSADENIRQVSIEQRNAHNEAFNGHNWGGISAHEQEDGIYLTFNLVINVQMKNIGKLYMVKPYITYLVDGREVTVYDSEVSERSVLQVADLVVKNLNEPETARQYCRDLLKQSS